MALQDQTIDIPLGGGVHQDFDHRLLPMGALAEVRNGVYEHTGAIVQKKKLEDWITQSVMA